jgi:hypothetical protein
VAIHSAIIDRCSRDLLFSMAANEGLIEVKKKGETDDVFGLMPHSEYALRMRSQILEQAVLTPKFALVDYPESLWDLMTGRLKEEGHIVNLERPEMPENQFRTISSDIVAGLVRASGNDIPIHEYQQRAVEAKKALEGEEEFTRRTGKSPPDLFQKNIIDFVNRAKLEVPYEYSDEEYAEQEQRQEKYLRFEPIARAMNEYVELCTLAEKHRYLVKTPILNEGGDNILDNPNYHSLGAIDEAVLFRIVGRELGKTTYRPTLKGSLDLAREPATAALRSQLSSWCSNLASGNVEELKKIRQEIKKATKALQRLPAIIMAGTITTWLSIPASLVETMFGLPPVLGLSVSAVGVVASAVAKARNDKYRWAMFGNT